MKHKSKDESQNASSIFGTFYDYQKKLSSNLVIFYFC